MQVYDKKRRESLVKATRSGLTAKGWRIEEVNAKSFDYRAKKGEVSFMIECIDGSVLDYKAPARVFEYLERQSESFREFGVPSVFVLANEFAACDLSSFHSRRLLGVLLSDIGALGDLDRLVGQLPASLSPLEIIFAQKSMVVASALSQNCKDAGDLEGAVAWAEQTVAIAPRALGHQRRLIELLRSQGDIARAASVCRDALRLSPNSSGLIAVLRELAKQLGDEKLMDSIEQHADERPKDGSAAEFLLGGRPISAAPAPSTPSPSNSSSSPDDTDGTKKQGAKRFFASLLGGRG